MDDLNFNPIGSDGYVTLETVILSYGGTVSAELFPYKEARTTVATITDALNICIKIANSTGLVNPDQLNVACNIANIEVSLRYVQPNCEALDQAEANGLGIKWGQSGYGALGFKTEPCARGCQFVRTPVGS